MKPSIVRHYNDVCKWRMRAVVPRRAGCFLNAQSLSRDDRGEVDVS